MNVNKPDITSLRDQATLILEKARRFSLVGFISLVALLYGFIFLRIDSLSGAEPSQDSINSQIQAAKAPHIDQSVVDQLQSLNDNSVSVQALFNQARNNPFQ